MSEIDHEGSSLRQRRLVEEKEILGKEILGKEMEMKMKVEMVALSNSSPVMVLETEVGSTTTSQARFPPLTMVIRKTSIVGCLLVVLGGLLWCIMQTVHSIQEWQSPSGTDMDPLCWPVVEAYLLLIAYLTLFVTVALFLLMIPSLVMTWIVTLVLTYLSSIGLGRERQQRRELVNTAMGWAKDMSWSTLQNAMREGKVFGVSAVLTLLMLVVMLGRSNIFAGQACH